MQIQINNLFVEQYKHDVRYYYNIGGRWSGKTWGVLAINILQALEKPGLRICAMRKTYESIKNTLYDDFLEVLKHMGFLYGVHYTNIAHPLRINFANGSNTIFKGANDREKIKGLSNVHHVILEEASEFEEMDFETVDQGIRGKKYKHKLFLMHNPLPRLPNSLFWFERLFSNKVLLEVGKNIYHDCPDMGKMVICKSTYKDNAFCPSSVRKRLEGYKNTNPELYKMWALGDYAEMKGLVFDNYDIVDKVPEGIVDQSIGYGLDFGFSIDPAACVKIWVHNDDIYVRGILYKCGLTNKDLFIELQAEGVRSNDIITADSAEPKSIDDLYRRGMKGIRAVKKRGNYKEDMVNKLRSFNIHVLNNDADIQKEFAMYQWSRDKNDKQLPRLQDGNDHYIDAFIMRMHDYYGSSKMTGQIISGI